MTACDDTGAACALWIEADGLDESAAQRGIDAALEVFHAARLEPAHCWSQVLARAAGDAWGERGWDTWHLAEAVALATAFDHWPDIPPGARLVLLRWRP